MIYAPSPAASRLAAKGISADRGAVQNRKQAMNDYLLLATLLLLVVYTYLTRA